MSIGHFSITHFSVFITKMLAEHIHTLYIACYFPIWHVLHFLEKVSNIIGDAMAMCSYKDIFMQDTSMLEDAKNACKITRL